MAVSNEVVIIAIGFMFNYLVVYQKSKFLGNILYMGTGILLMSFSLEPIVTGIGLLMLIGGFISLIVDFIRLK